jgi:hypothetical protein
VLDFLRSRMKHSELD